MKIKQTKETERCSYMDTRCSIETVLFSTPSPGNDTSIRLDSEVSPNGISLLHPVSHPASALSCLSSLTTLVPPNQLEQLHAQGVDVTEEVKVKLPKRKLNRRERLRLRLAARGKKLSVTSKHQVDNTLCTSTELSSLCFHTLFLSPFREVKV